MTDQPIYRLDVFPPVTVSFDLQRSELFFRGQMAVANGDPAPVAVHFHGEAAVSLLAGLRHVAGGLDTDALAATTRRGQQ